MPYAFLPEFSRGLAVPIRTLVVILSGLAALSIIAPIFGRIPERFGSRWTMCSGMVILVLGTSTVLVSPTVPAFIFALGLGVLAKIIYDPALQSHLSHRVHYSRRGRVLAMTELAWSMPMLVGMPMLGWLMSRSIPPESAWRVPFPILVGLGSLSALALWFTLHTEDDDGIHQMKHSRTPWETIFANRSVLGGLGVCLLIHAGQENLSVVYGAWLEQSFGLAIVALGLATSVIGLGELAGEGGVMALADRMGKRRAVAAGIGLSMASYIALPLVGTTLPGALIGLFSVFFSFEFTIVALIPLMSEMVPEARSSVMSLNIGAQASGRMIGALVGGALINVGMGWTGIAAAVLNGIALLFLLVWVREKAADS